MKSRRNVSTLIALVAAAALLATPLAGADSDAGGKRLISFGLSFDGVYKRGKPVKVKNLVYSNLGMTCDGGGYIYSPSKKFPKLDVNRKLKFRGTLKVDGITSRVVGKYKRNLSKVTGTVRATGETAGRTNCSAKIEWETD